jgi:hypothetical protein
MKLFFIEDKMNTQTVIAKRPATTLEGVAYYSLLDEEGEK